MYKLFIDDIRPRPSNDWIVARSSKEAIEIIQSKGLPDSISFDHDLGGDDKATSVIREITEMLLDNEIVMNPSFRFLVHSDNPTGKDNIILDMKNIYYHFCGVVYPVPDHKLWVKNGQQTI